MAVKYKCANCGYSFTRQEDKSVNICPYCGKTKTLRTESRSTATKLNKMIDDA